jgi:hypothetical protein
MALAELDYVEVGRPLPLHAGERSEPDSTRKVRLALLKRLRVISGRHRQFAQKRIVEMLDVHGGILTGVSPRESGCLAPVRLWDSGIRGRGRSLRRAS